jgi:Uma2 family endonuclease
MRRQRWEAVPAEARETFIPLAPDFVIELRSPSDRLADLQAKMGEYQAAGAALGWLIDPVERRVHVYAAGGDVVSLDSPARLSGDPTLSGFVLELDAIWRG